MIIKPPSQPSQPSQPTKPSQGGSTSGNPYNPGSGEVKQISWNGGYKITLLGTNIKPASLTFSNLKPYFSLSACKNIEFAYFAYTNGSITVRKHAQSIKNCKNNNDNDYVNALQSVVSFTASDNVITCFDSSGIAIVKYEGTDSVANPAYAKAYYVSDIKTPPYITGGSSSSSGSYNTGKPSTSGGDTWTGSSGNSNPGSTWTGSGSNTGSTWTGGSSSNSGSSGSTWTGSSGGSSVSGGYAGGSSGTSKNGMPTYKRSSAEMASPFYSIFDLFSLPFLSASAKSSSSGSGWGVSGSGWGVSGSTGGSGSGWGVSGSVGTSGSGWGVSGSTGGSGSSKGSSVSQSDNFWGDDVNGDVNVDDNTWSSSVNDSPYWQSGPSFNTGSKVVSSKGKRFQKGKYKLSLPKVDLDITKDSFVFRGCNSHRVPSTYQKGRVSFNKPVSTKFSCATDHALNVVNTLPSFTTCRQHGDSLRFYNKHFQ